MTWLMLLLLVLLQWRAGTAIGPVMVRTGLGHKAHRHTRSTEHDKEHEGKECGGQNISPYL
jgi:hypothetical protein